MPQQRPYKSMSDGFPTIGTYHVRRHLDPELQGQLGRFRDRLPKG